MVHKPRGLFIAIFHPPPIVVLRGFSGDPPPKKNTWHFAGKKCEFTGRFFTHKRTLIIIIICYILWKKYGTMLISQYINHSQSISKSRTGKDKLIANEEKGRWGPDKDAHLKTPSLMCRVSPRFQQKKKKSAKKDHVVFCRTPFRAPIVVWRGLKRTPLP